MRICIISDYIPGYHEIEAGAERAAHSMAKVLNQKHEVIMLTKKPKKKYKEEFKCDYIKTTEDYLGEKTGLYFTRLKSLWFPYDLISFINAYKKLKKLKPDLIMLTNFRELSFSIVKAARKLKIPMIYSLYDWWCLCPKTTLINNEKKTCNSFHGSKCKDCFKGTRFKTIKTIMTLLRKKIFNKFFLKKMNHFIVLAQQWKDILSKYGVKRKKITVVPLPLHKKINPKKTKNKKKSILFVGWIQWRKGLKQVIKAMPQVIKKHPETKLYAIGPTSEPDYKEWIEKFIKKKKINNNVKLLGKQSHKKVNEWFNKVQLCVIPEQWPIAWPIALTEAMAYAKPIVASRIGGIPDLINKENGLLAKPTKPEEFSKKINWMLSNPKKARKMGKEARKKIMKTCSPKNIINKIEKINRKIKNQQKSL